MEDFRRFFVRGLAALMPTLITLWLLIKIWSFLWESLGQHLIWSIKRIWIALSESGVLPYKPIIFINTWFEGMGEFRKELLGVGLAIVLVYFMGLFVGNIIGRTGWRLIEVGALRIPLVRAIYPAVKQVTDFVLADKNKQFQSSRVVAVCPHENNIWSLGLVTGSGLRALDSVLGEDIVTVFVPSTPTAFTGYVLVVPRKQVVELPMTVEEAMRLLVTGGVVMPRDGKVLPGGAALLPGASSIPATTEKLDDKSPPAGRLES